MNAAQLVAWRNRLGMSKAEAANALGCSRNTIAAWEAERFPVPKYIELACKFLALDSALGDNLRSALDTLEGTGQ